MGGERYLPEHKFYSLHAQLLTKKSLLLNSSELDGRFFASSTYSDDVCLLDVCSFEQEILEVPGASMCVLVQVGCTQ